MQEHKRKFFILFQQLLRSNFLMIFLSTHIRQEGDFTGDVIQVKHMWGSLTWIYHSQLVPLNLELWTDRRKRKDAGRRGLASFNLTMKESIVQLKAQKQESRWSKNI